MVYSVAMNMNYDTGKIGKTSGEACLIDSKCKIVLLKSANDPKGCWVKKKKSHDEETNSRVRKISFRIYFFPLIQFFVNKDQGQVWLGGKLTQKNYCEIVPVAQQVVQVDERDSLVEMLKTDGQALGWRVGGKSVRPRGFEKIHSFPAPVANDWKIRG